MQRHRVSFVVIIFTIGGISVVGDHAFSQWRFDWERGGPPVPRGYGRYLLLGQALLGLNSL